MKCEALKDTRLNLQDILMNDDWNLNTKFDQQSTAIRCSSIAWLFFRMLLVCNEVIVKIVASSRKLTTWLQKHLAVLISMSLLTAEQ